jgi:hypothetical protein
MLNCIGVMPMRAQLVILNKTAFCANNSMSRGASICTQEKGFSHPSSPIKSNIQTNSQSLKPTKTKKPCMSPSQERNDILLNGIRDIIDKKHLQIDTDNWFRPTRGVFWSFYKIARLPSEQVNDELTAIESYIPVQDKEYFLQKLADRHHYVDMLLQIAVCRKWEEIQNNIKGSTVDSFFYPPKQNGFKKMVHIRALENYFSTIKINSEVEHSVYLSIMSHSSGSENTHATILYGNSGFEIDKDSLAMSSDSKYLRAVDFGGNEIIWDMETGKRICLTNREKFSIRWTNSLGKTIRMRRFFEGEIYSAVLLDEKDIADAVRLEKSDLAYAPYLSNNLKEWTHKAIVLHKTPQKEAYFVQEVFDNSNSKEELFALLSSRTFAAIKGFPKENFKTHIRAKINKL